MANVNVDAIKKKKLAAIRAAFKQIDKFTKQQNTAFIMGERPVEEVKRFSSGSLMLDIALGGGLCYGRIHEIYGGESSGKTLTMLKAIASCQADGGICAFVDAEQSFSPSWAEKIGVNVDELIFSQPDSLEDTFEVVLALAESGGVDLIVVDSVAAMVPKKEIDDPVGQQNIALTARGMSVNLRKLVPIAAKSNCAVVFINQIRDNVAVLYGNPTNTTGGSLNNVA